MTDDELIEAMTLAYDEEDNYGNLAGAMKAALAVARPIIERETRERCAKIADKYVKNVEPVAGTAWLIAREIMEEQ